MNTSPPIHPAPGAAVDPAAAAAPAAPGALTAAADERQRHLFRHTLREQLVNPLIHILRSHRQEPRR